MDVICAYLIVIGLFFGSFYNCLADRLCNSESIVKPGSHCENCHKKLTWYELIPVFSYIILKGKCRKCKTKLSFWYPITEIATSVLFALCYLRFGFSIETLISLTIVSILVITFVSDLKYYIILDEVIFIGLLLLTILMYFNTGFIGIFHGVCGASFLGIIMLLIKIIGDKAFKTESLGWGDVKLSLIAGFILGIRLGTIYIFLASLIALPFALIFSYKSKMRIVPFGPFLSISLLIIYWYNSFFYNIINQLFGGLL